MTAAVAERPAKAGARVAPASGVKAGLAPADLDRLFGPQWRNLEWRLDHLYRVIDKHGRDVPFRLNDDQRDFVRHMHTRNVIIKSRQRGFSTLIQLLQLDQALFRKNTNGVTISDTVPNAGKLMAKVEFALRKLPQALADAVPVKTREARTMLEFEHDSTVTVSTSSRGGTVQLLHVSELGKIARKWPERAQEIVTGAFESVPVDETIIVESTTEGAQGALYDIAWPAYQAQLAGEPETQLSWRLHFYPWYTDRDCVLSDEDTANVVVSDAMALYFRKFEAEQGITLTPNQRAFYVAKRATLGRLIKREYPGSVEEAFEAAIEGAIFGEEMTLVREAGRITTVPIDREHVVHTFWDFGTGNRMVVWCMQRINLQNRWVRYFTADGTGLGSLWRQLEKWRAETGEWRWGTHHLPHDADTERLGEGIDTYQRILVAAGMRNEIVVPRVSAKSIAIDLARQKLPADNWFDRTGCAEGIKCLDGYQFAWNEKLGVWSNEPLGNWASHGADAWMQYAQGFQPMTEARARNLKAFKNRPRRGI